jgi:hypothetical protein
MGPRFIVALFLTVAVQGFSLSPEELEFFERKVRPVLAERCYECHSANARKVKGNLLLDSRAGILKGGDSGSALIAGDPEKASSSRRSVIMTKTCRCRPNTGSIRKR